MKLDLFCSDSMITFIAFAELVVVQSYMHAFVAFDMDGSEQNHCSMNIYISVSWDQAFFFFLNGGQFIIFSLWKIAICFTGRHSGIMQMLDRTSNLGIVQSWWLIIFLIHCWVIILLPNAQRLCLFQLIILLFILLWNTRLLSISLYPVNG